MRGQRFIKKVSYAGLPPNEEIIQESIKGIKRLINRFKRDAYRSNVPEYVLKREEKIEKLQFILIDLKKIERRHKV